MDHVSSRVTVQVIDDFERVAPSLWDDLCQPDTYFPASYLSALARAGLDCSFRYFLARKAGQVVGVTFGYSMRFPLFGQARPLLFIGGSPVTYHFPFAFRAPGSHREVFLALVQAMIAEARRQRAAALVLRDLWSPGPLDEYRVVLQKLRFFPQPLFQKAWLDLRWRTFEEYLAAFRTHYRSNIRHDLRSIEEQKSYRSLVATSADIQPYLADMARLCEYLCAKYHDRDQLRLPISYFHEMTSIPECSTFLLLHNERLAAFIISLARDSYLETNYCGVDASLTGKDPAHRYIEHEIIRYALARGFQAIDFGISNEAPKMRIGCRLQGLYGFIRPLSPLARGLARLRLYPLLFPEYGFKVKAADPSGSVLSSAFRPCEPEERISVDQKVPTVSKNARKQEKR